MIYEEPVLITKQDYYYRGINPTVSICCITFNHENYIRDTIEGFLNQKTRFQVEIIIHDDASTDDTSKIIKEYKDEYPNLFTIIIQDENQWSKGEGSIYSRFVFPEARGKYIALCEGDDYWTDCLKIQKQVEFLEKNSSFSVSCGMYGIIKGVSLSHKSIKNSFEFNLNDTLDQWYTKTLTVVFRRSSLPDLNSEIMKLKNFRDTHLIYLLLREGKGYCFKDCFGVQRIHEGGVNSMKSITHHYQVAYIISKELYGATLDLYWRKKLLKSILSIINLKIYSLNKELKHLKFNFLLRQAFSLTSNLGDIRYYLRNLLPYYLKLYINRIFFKKT